MTNFQRMLLFFSCSFYFFKRYIDRIFTAFERPSFLSSRLLIATNRLSLTLGSNCWIFLWNTALTLSSSLFLLSSSSQTLHSLFVRPNHQESKKEDQDKTCELLLPKNQLSHQEPFKTLKHRTWTILRYTDKIEHIILSISQWTRLHCTESNEHIILFKMHL